MGDLSSQDYINHENTDADPYSDIEALALQLVTELARGSSPWAEKSDPH
jgi:hypothetical protein